MEVAIRTQSQTDRPNHFARYAFGVTALTLAVILWGAYVRASRSGDGCGAHWPLCNGTVALPQAGETKTMVEFAHRATSGLDGLAIVLLVVWAFRKYPRGHAVRAGACACAAFFVTESLIGAGLVLLGLVANNASLARAAYLSVHLVNTFALLASLALTAWWASVGATARARLREFLRGRAGAALAGALALGVSGAVAALGATLFPESAPSELAGRHVTPQAQLLFSLRHYKLHPLLAALVGGYLIYFAVSLFKSRRDAWVRRWSAAVITLVLAQLGVGLVNAALLAPVRLQIVHLLLADLLWLALVLLSASSLAQTETPSEDFERARLGATLEI
ncbi:MAG: cytochrome oxidase assembly protein [Acidobacteria bacterium]|nr:MAG: cytochrome oxidase assembly protein [Acidobacteriota bacterium]